MRTEDALPQMTAVQPRLIRVRTLTRLRWFAVVGQLSVTLGVLLILGYEVPVGPILLVVAVGVWYNLYQSFTRSPVEALAPNELVRQLIFDMLQIGAVLFLTGGTENPFALWLILPAMLGASSLDRRRAAIVVVSVVTMITFLSLMHYPLPGPGPMMGEDSRTYLLGSWAALMLGTGFVSTYAYQVASSQEKLSSALDAAEHALAREERLTALGGLAAAAAHELGTPLGTIQVTAKEMANELPEGPLREDAELLISQTQRCQRILKRLSNAGDNPDARHAVMSLEELLREAAKPFLADGNKAIEFTFDSASQTMAPERLGRRAEVIYGLRTLIENAVKFADETVSIHANWDAQTITLAIEDDGPGFASDVLSRLGEPYPRHDGLKQDPKSGLGLGFFIAKTLLERTGAKLKYGNGRRKNGAYVDITWPLANLRAAPTS